MNILDLKENKKHGTTAFPVAIYKSSYGIPYQWHDEEEIIYMLEGQADYNIDGEIIRLKKGDCAFCQGSVLHSMLIEPNQNTSFYALLFDKSYIINSNDICGSYMKNISINKYFCADSEKEFTSIIYNICNIMNEKTFGYEWNVKSLLAKIYYTILKNKLYSEYNTSDTDSKRIAAAIGHIHSNFNRKITVAELAAITGYSIPYFESFFKKYTEKTPIEYLLLYRLKIAQERLLKSNSTITDIAYECGFTNVSYFIRQFKAVYGITPYKYRLNS